MRLGVVDGSQAVLSLAGMQEMKPWARAFYNSKAWKQCRAAYIASVNGLCERCTTPTPGKIVHHKIWLTAKNIGDPNVSLNHKHLEYLCLPCHNTTHYASPIAADGLRFDCNGDLVSRDTYPPG